LFFEKQGFKPSWFWLSLACLGEFGGGLSLATGFLTPLGAAGIVGAMSMAAFKTHWKNGFFTQNGGFEYPLTILVVSLFFGLAGPGTFSLDALLRINLPGRALFIVCALLASVVVGIGILVSTRQKAQPIG
ncbi:MAG TPA: DoxX family protein, partial [Methylococcales bacterium]